MDEIKSIGSSNIGGAPDSKPAPPFIFTDKKQN